MSDHLSPKKEKKTKKCFEKLSEDEIAIFDSYVADKIGVTVVSRLLNVSSKSLRDWKNRRKNTQPMPKHGKRKQEIHIPAELEKKLRKREEHVVKEPCKPENERKPISQDNFDMDFDGPSTSTAQVPELRQEFDCSLSQSLPFQDCQLDVNAEKENFDTDFDGPSTSAASLEELQNQQIESLTGIVLGQHVNWECSSIAENVSSGSDQYFVQFPDSTIPVDHCEDALEVDLNDLTLADCIEELMETQNLDELEVVDEPGRPRSPAYLTLASTLSMQLLVVPQEDSTRREYNLIKGTKSETQYFQCPHCQTCIRRVKDANAPKLKKKGAEEQDSEEEEEDGDGCEGRHRQDGGKQEQCTDVSTVAYCQYKWGSVSGETQHHPHCKPLDKGQLIARDVKRRCFLRLTELDSVDAVWEAGLLELQTTLRREGLPITSDSEAGIVSAMTYFPNAKTYRAIFNRVRNQYTIDKDGNRKKRDKKESKIYDPFKDVLGRITNTISAEMEGQQDDLILAQSVDYGCLIFATTRDLELFADSEVLIGDATFNIVPNLARQFHTIHAKHHGQWVPVIHTLMRSKELQSYKFLFQTVKEKCEALGLHLKCKKFLTDFEAGEMNAISDVFGEDKVKGCLFHFCQAVLRKAGQKGLKVWYKEEPTINV